MDRGEVTSLILLDLSAAFDTVDHSILFTRLQNWFGLDGLCSISLLTSNSPHIIGVTSGSGWNTFFENCAVMK